ncbi:hypothetical protein FACS18949_05600 [Clostridia bacterium]|nr:hypothetical protein FACS18949_05600 [Clostridia bacterium]
MEERVTQRYTYKEYLTWDDDKRYELIDGIPYMPVAPSVRHQSLLGNFQELDLKDIFAEDNL